jgi:F0F1-type ATP synthase assembly protein I
MGTDFQFGGGWHGRKKRRYHGFMSSFILGLISTILVGLYFGFYLLALRSLPLGIIFAVVFALAVVDFIETTRKKRNEGQN